MSRMRATILAIALCHAPAAVIGYVPSSARRCATTAEAFMGGASFRRGTQTRVSPLMMAKKKKNKNRGKGFGSTEPAAQEAAVTTTIPTRRETADEEEMPDFDAAAEFVPSNIDVLKAPEGGEMNAGQKALSQMREKRAQEKEDELRKVKELRAVDESLREDPSAAVIPEKVAMRMGKRMLPFVGVPLFGGMGAFVAFWYLATQKNMEFQPNMVAGSTIAILVIGLVGITYSVLSASWDPEVEGTALGKDEFGKNLDEIRSGLKRSRENAILREKMQGMPEAEIQRAIRALDERDEKARQRKMSFDEKMKKELE